MNRKILFLSLFAIFAYLTGCSDKEDAMLEINETSIAFTGVDDDGGSFYITSNTKWTVRSSDEWLKFTPSSGEGNGGVVVTASYNQNPGIRSGTITVSTDGGITKTLQVMQLGTDPAIVVNREAVDMTFRSGNIFLFITASEEWEVQIPSAAQSWLSVWAETSVRKNAVAIISVTRNEAEEARKAELIFKLKTKDQQFRVLVEQDLLSPPKDLDYPEEADIGDEIIITGQNLSVIDEIWFGDLLGTISGGRTATEMKVTIPITAIIGINDLKIVYADDFTLPTGVINLLPVIPLIETDLPDNVTIGRAFTLTGKKLNLIDKVFVDDIEAHIGISNTSLTVVIPMEAAFTALMT